MQPAILKPANKTYGSSHEAMEAFYEGHWFFHILPDGMTPYVTLDDFAHGDLVKIEFMKIIGDTNHGNDPYLIDRTFSVQFPVDKLH